MIGPASELSESSTLEAHQAVAFRLLPAEVTANAVRDTARQLLTDPVFSSRAGDLRDELRAMPHPDDLVPMIEQLAAGGTA